MSVCVLTCVCLRSDKDVEYFKKAIESILNQTYKNFRYLIICDGESNKSGIFNIIDKYNDLRIEVHFKPHSGLTDSMNFGLNLINEDYILRQDADDLSAPDRLEKLLNAIDEETAIVGCNYGIIDGDGTINHINTADPEKLETKDIAGSIAGGGVLLKTDVIKKLGGWKYAKAQDLYMMVMCRNNGYKVKSVKETLYYYRVHKGQISHNERDEQKECHRDIVRDLCK
jgi:glycosyltransferase involved in cell wall biosynthesis